MTISKMMLAMLAVAVAFTSCKNDGDDEIVDEHVEKHSLTFVFKHQVNGDSLELDTMKYANAFGNQYKVEFLRYLISNIRLSSSAGTCNFGGYHLVNIDSSSTFAFTPETQLPHMDISGISFTFGFDEVDNVNGAYPDLNAVGWPFPMMLGGGYHFLQLNGTYMDDTGALSPFLTHMGTAREITPTDTIFHPNHFTSTLPSSGFTVSGDMRIEIIMNLNKWYENPNLWDLNQYDAPIMPIYEAQIWLNENGHDVFSVGSITAI